MGRACVALRRAVRVFLSIAVLVASLPVGAGGPGPGIQAIVGVFAGPSPFTPEVDGLLYIGFMIEYESHPIRVSVTGPGLSLVLAERTVEPQVGYTLAWNGRNGSGDIVGSGTYTVHLDLLDDAAWSTSTTFVVARRPGPRVSLSTTRPRRMPVLARVPCVPGSRAACFEVTGPDPRKGGSVGAWRQVVQALDADGNYVAYVYADASTPGATTIRCSYLFAYGESLTGPAASFDYLPPPPPPVIASTLPVRVFRPEVDVSGTVAAGLDVLVFHDGRQVAEITPGGTSWTCRVKLAEGYNHIVAVSRDSEGCPSDPSSPVATIYDPLGKYAGDLDPKTALSTLGGLYASGYMNDPVNTATGAFVHQARDLYLSGPLPMAWTRTYNSLDPYPDPLGNGWRSSFSWAVRAEDGGTLVVVRPDGRRDNYHPAGDGTLTPPLGVFDTLERTAAGYRLLIVSGELGDAGGPGGAGGFSLLFGPSGQLGSIEDASGRRLTLTYEDAPAAWTLARLASVRDKGGRGLNFTYDERGLLVRVADTAGRSVTYEHDGAGNLTAVTSVFGEATRYDYSERDQMTAITAPDGTVILSNSYDGQYRVIRQADAAGRVTSFVYDPTRQTTTVTAPDGRIVVDRYDEHFRLLARTEPDGGTVSFAYGQRGTRDRITFPDGRSATLTHDGQGNLTGLTDRTGVDWALSYRGSSLTGLTDPDGGAWSFGYDPAGRLTERVDPLGGRTAYEYDAGGNLVAIGSALGEVTRLEYGSSGQVVAVRDSLGFVAAYTYDGLGLPATVTDARGGVTKLDYDEAGRLVRLEDALGGVTTRAYNWRGQVVAETYPNGYGLTSTYGPDGTLAAITDSLGWTRSYIRDALGNVLVYRDALGRETTYTYDAAGRLASETDPSGATTRFGYDGAGNLAAVTGPSGYRETFAYDAAGRLLERTNPVGGRNIYEYDSRGNLVAFTDAHGLTTLTLFDALNRPVQVTSPSGATTETEYDALGRATRYRDEAGGERRYAYDGRGNVVSATDPLGGVTGYEYGPGGDRIAVVNPAGDRWTYAWDLLGRLVSQADPLGNTTSFIYDSRGNLTASQDPLGFVRTYEYDPSGLLVAESEPAGDALGRVGAATATSGVTRYQRDAVGQVTAITDSRGAVTRFTYDPRGLLASRIDPLGRRTTFAYSPEGWLTGATYPDGTTIERAYDPAGWLTGVTYPDGSERAYNYDQAGLLLSISDGLGTISYDYDDLFRPAAVTGVLGDTVGYRWDAQGRLTSLVYPDGRSATYDYDLLGRLAAVHDWAGQTTSYGYDLAGRPAGVTHPGGLETSYDYDAAGRLTGLAHLAPDGKTVASYAYSFDARGQITTIAELGGRMTTYTYDPSGRLIEAVESGGTSGSSESVESAAAVESAERAESVEATGSDARVLHAWRYVYDQAGNVLTIAETEQRPGEAPATTVTGLEYDLASQLIRAVTLDPDGDTEETAYSFDARGNLVKEERPLPDADSAQMSPATASIARSSAGGASDQGAGKGGGTGNGQGNGSGGGGGNGNGGGSGGGNGNQPGHGRPADPGANGKRKAVTAYRYDFDGRLLEVIQGDGTETGIARYVRFTYDAAGNKLALDAWAKAPGNGNHYGWDKNWKEGKSGQGVDPQGQGEGRAAQGKSGNSSSGGKPAKDPVRELSLSLRYVMNPLARSPEALTVTDGLDQTTTYLYGLGRLAAYDSAGAPAYFLTDHAGSVRQMSTPGGSVLERYSYSPYGVPLGGDLDPGARLATGNLFGFTGAEHTRPSLWLTWGPEPTPPTWPAS